MGYYIVPFFLVLTGYIILYRITFSLLGVFSFCRHDFTGVVYPLFLVFSKTEYDFYMSPFDLVLLFGLVVLSKTFFCLSRENDK